MVTDLERRILEISYKHKLSHLGSCLTAVGIIDKIYRNKKKDEKFVLSSGHAGLALYVVIEKYEGIDAEKIFKHHGTHPDYCINCQIDCSTGSLGHGIGIAAGMALADREKNVYCLLSDGEMAEGSVYEVMNVMVSKKINNLKLYVNANGFGAYSKIKINPPVIFETVRTNVKKFPFLKGLDAHYHVMTKEEYEAYIC